MLDRYLAIVEQEIDTNEDALRWAFEDILGRAVRGEVQYGGNANWLIDDLIAAVRRELLETLKESVAEARMLENE